MDILAQHSTSGCAACPRRSPDALERYGLDTADADFIVALAGNPNTGKSTIFNALTGLRQHVGNWPGKTVAIADGAFETEGAKFRIVDLPGTYSLLSNSADEEVARDFILFGKPDVTVIVADATALDRNLNLVLQVLEITDRAVVALNLMDEAVRGGISIDDRSLARDLGVPVVPMAARRGRGIAEMVKVLAGVARGDIVCRPRRLDRYGHEVEASIDRIVAALLQEFPDLPNARWVAIRLLEADASVIRAVGRGTLGDGGARQAEPQPIGAS